MPHLYSCLSDNGYIRKNGDKKETVRESERQAFIFFISICKDEERTQREMISWNRYYTAYFKEILKNISSSLPSYKV